MHDIDANERLRELCQQILEEQDPQRVEELIGTLRSAVQVGQDEARLRMSYVARHYYGRLQGASPSHGSEQLHQGTGRIRALLNFLGLGAGMRLGREMEG
jgi:hypothetical protein